MKLTQSFIFVSVATFLFFLINVFAFYLLLRGHNFPGGGFIGGLGSAISLILLSLAIGVKTMDRILRFDPVAIAAAGLLIAFLTSCIGMFAGDPFLTQYNLKLTDVPLLGELALGTPLLFDIGVYLVVVGVTTKMIFLLARSVEGHPAFEDHERDRYASVIEEPIENLAAPPRESPVSDSKLHDV
ncbi:MAG: Na(+)/H(+) antiporter subunit B [Puniceicoccaceae bacterium]|nr:MAG: Na(+)/H(+) antiporter subunit B [Puniceicoccaceae bacterium]